MRSILRDIHVYPCSFRTSEVRSDIRTRGRRTQDNSSPKLPASSRRRRRTRTSSTKVKSSLPSLQLPPRYPPTTLQHHRQTHHYYCLHRSSASISIPRGIVPTSYRCRVAATSPIRHPTAPCRIALPAQHLRPTGFLCDWSVGLEFPAGELAGSGH